MTRTMIMTRTMPSTNPPQKKPSKIHLEKRQALLDIALQCFIEQGLDQTSVNNIIQKVGIAKGTFYHYFPSKEALILELRQHYMQSFFEVIETEISKVPKNQENEWNQRLHAWFRGSAKHYAQHKAIHDALFHHNHQIEDTEDREKIICYLEDFLLQGIHERAWTVESPNLVAKLMYHGMHIAFDESHESDEAILQLEADKLYRLFHAMLHASI